MQHGLDRGDGIDLWDTSWGTQLDRGDGIDLRGHAIGVWHWLGHVMGARLDQRDGIDLRGHDMGVRHWLDVNDEIDLWGYSNGAHNWIGAMELICGGESWGRMTLARSGWGDWFMWACHEGAWHWLDWVMEMIHGGVSNDKVLYGCWIWITIPCVLCLALR